MIYFLNLTFSFALATAEAQILYQPPCDSPILHRNPSLTGEGRAFDFLIGDWDVDITLLTTSSNPDRYKAKWHNHWIVDGTVVMQEWRGPKATGAEFRFYDKEKKVWEGRNIYVNGAWRNTIAQTNNENMIVTIFGFDKKRGNFLNRETYFNIKKDSFEMKSEISLDNGETWKKGGYSMIVTRIKAQ